MYFLCDFSRIESATDEKIRPEKEKLFVTLEEKVKRNKELNKLHGLTKHYPYIKVT